MCDTWVALPDVTEFGQLIFTKNSDRPAFDCQPLVHRPRQSWTAGSRVVMEYVELPQVAETYAHLGSRPYWSFGYESGINEHGVVIGNEAIFTRAWRAATVQHRNGAAVPLGLSGMDIIRLALERARSAADAVRVMGAFIEQYGQFGSGVPGKSHADGSYDNSFVVADAREAWVLETAGREWAARCYIRGYTSISNQPSLRTAWDEASSGLTSSATKQGWWAADRPFDFAAAFTDDLVARQVSHLRVMRSRQLLRDRAGRIDAAWMKRIARDHYEDTFLNGPLFNPADPDVLTLCMHDSPGGFTWGNTAASCIALQPQSADGLPVYWWTPGPPCNSCYVPFFVAANGVPDSVSRAGVQGDSVRAPNDVAPDEFSPGSYWWLFRRLLDATTGGAGHRGDQYAHRNPIVRRRFDALEAAFEAECATVSAEYRGAAAGPARARVLADFSARCVEKVTASIHELLAEFGEPVRR